MAEAHMEEQRTQELRRWLQESAAGPRGDIPSQPAKDMLAVLAEVARLEGELARDRRLRDIINSDLTDCPQGGKCDSYAHDDDCPGDPANLIVKLKQQRDRALAALRSWRAEIEAPWQPPVNKGTGESSAFWKIQAESINGDRAKVRERIDAIIRDAESAPAHEQEKTEGRT